MQFFFAQYIVQPPFIYMLHGFCVALRGHDSPVIALPFWCSRFILLAAFFFTNIHRQSHDRVLPMGTLETSLHLCLQHMRNSQRRPCVECMFVFVCLLAPNDPPPPPPPTFYPVRISCLSFCEALVSGVVQDCLCTALNDMLFPFPLTVYPRPLLHAFSLQCDCGCHAFLGVGIVPFYFNTATFSCQRCLVAGANVSSTGCICDLSMQKQSCIS